MVVAVAAIDPAPVMFVGTGILGDGTAGCNALILLDAWFREPQGRVGADGHAVAPLLVGKPAVSPPRGQRMISF